MSHASLTPILTALQEGRVVPYLGPGVLSGVVDTASGRPIPADSEQLILALNDGRPMAPKLMYEFPRAAMHVELKRGRATLQRFLDATYRDTRWSRSALHAGLARLNLPYIIDTNRDTLLQQEYACRPHLLVVGLARIAGSDYRYKLYLHDGTAYRLIEQEAADTRLPVLFKPLGTPLPQSHYVASDADFVDYITELMGGFAIPDFVKRLRMGKRYLILGMRFTRDTQRMIITEMIYGAAQPAGWALIPEPTDKERRFLDRLGIEIIQADVSDLLV